MLKTKDTDELEYYIDHIAQEKLAKPKNRADSLSYWKGLKTLSEKSLKIQQTPKALSTLKNANLALGDRKANTKMIFNSSASEMRKYANFFAEEGKFKKASLTQATEVYEHIFRNIKSTSNEDAKNAAKIYSELARLQLSDKEFIEAEKSINRGLELDKTHRKLYVNQILVYLLTNRYEQAKKAYQQEVRNDKANKSSLKLLVREDIEKLEKTGKKIDKTKATWLK